MPSPKHLLVLGAGSVGKRHLRNFAGLGCRVSVMEPRADRLAEAAEQVPLAQRFASLEAALAEPAQFAGVVICSPTKFHVEQAEAAAALGLPVYLEKPVSTDEQSALRLRDVLRRFGGSFLLGYTYRWWPPVADLRTRLDQGVIGRVLHARCVMSAHLADWHPWERYQDFFMASKDLGGGALLDESHVVDLMLWFFGMPAQVFARVERLSSLEIATDDNVDAWLSYASGLRVVIHLDLYGRPHERSVTITGEQGTLHWSFEANRLCFSQSADPNWSETSFSCERNDMFMGAAREFLRLIDARDAPSCSIEDGCAVMRVIEALRQSSANGRVVSLE